MGIMRFLPPFCLALASCLIAVGCSSAQHYAQSTQVSTESAPDQLLIKQVLTYSGDSEDEASTSWKDLQNYPREELIGNLNRLLNSYLKATIVGLASPSSSVG
jgi:hypothetical protein